MTKYNGIKTLEVLEGADNYNAWIAERIGGYIKSPAIEVGSGIGSVSSHFVNLKKLILTDIDSELVEKLKIKFEKRKNVEVNTIDISNPKFSKNSKFRTVYSINVLEHLRDDVSAISNMSKFLTSNGRIVLLVPANKIAYTKLDKELGHFRRYEKSELRQKLEQCDLIVEELEYFNAVGLISWIVRSVVTNNHNELKSSHVKLFDSIVPFLKKIEPKQRLPIGISLIAVARKK